MRVPKILSDNTPLGIAIFEATKNIVVYRETSSGSAKVDWVKTGAAKLEAENRVRREWEGREAKKNS